MIRYLAAASMLLCAAANAADTTVAPGKWDVRSTTVDMSVPGMPTFVARMMRGKSKVEHKRLAAGQGVEALLAPDPKANCRIADGRYRQTLTCPQKRGQPVQVTRAGSYSQKGFAGDATVAGRTDKGPMRISLTQRATRVGD
jgi:hypothetical protein